MVDEWEEWQPLLDQVGASMIVKLIRHHKVTCVGETCDISLGLLIPTYERLVKRQITQEELRIFL